MRNYLVVLLFAFGYSVLAGFEASHDAFVKSIGKVNRDQAIPMHGTNESSRQESLKFASNGLLKLPAPGSLKFPDAKKSKIRLSSWSTHSSINPGSDFVVVVRISLDQGWHIYGEGETNGIVTNLELLSGEFLEQEQGLSESVKKQTNLGSKVLVSYYLVDGGFAWIRLKLRDDLTIANSINLKLRLNYQLCSESVCLLPSTANVVLPIGFGRAKNNQPPVEFQKSQALFQLNDQPEVEKAASPNGSSGQLDQLIGQNVLLALLMAFLWGLLASLTPCVYPMIPITVSLFSSGTGSSSKVHRFIGACFYVAGIALVYAILGVITSYSGRDLGSWLAEPVVVVPLSLLIILLALSMFGLFEMDLPNSMKTRLNSIEGRSPFTLFCMGAAMGFVAAPCVGPFAGSIILWLAKNPGSPVFGFLLMTAFGLGMGCLFLIIAVFSQSFLPRSGLWMVRLKQSMGYILIGMAYYFLSVLIPEDKVIVGWSVYLMIAGGLMGAFAQLEWEAIWWKHLFKTLGLILFLAGGFHGMLFMAPKSASGKIREGVVHSSRIYTDFDIALEEARNSEKPLFLYFGARWCIPCKKIKAVVLEDKVVKKMLTRFVVAHLDCTQASSKSAELKEKRFNSHSMPFFAFFDSKGNHLKQLDIHGSVGIEDLIDQLSEVE